MAKINLNKYSSLKFDTDKVINRTNAFLAQNPNLSEKQKEELVHKIIMEEALISSFVGAYKKFNPKEDLKEYSTKIRNNITSGKDKNIIFFNKYKGSDSIDIAKNVQNKVKTATDFRDFSEGVSSNLTTLRNIYCTSHEAENYKKNMASLYDQSFFNMTTQPDLYEQKYESQATKDKVTEWQKQTNEVIIPAPKGISEDLISSAVLGEMLKDENLIKGDKIVHGEGSTLLSVVNTANTVKMAFFENMTGRDERLNMHVARAIIPECRKNVKSMVEANDIDGLMANVKHAARILYENAVKSGLTNSTLTYSTGKLTQLLDAAAKSNISAEELGFSKDELDKIKATQLRAELDASKDSFVEKYRENFKANLLSNGKDPQYGFINNPKAQEELLEVMAKATIANAINTEVAHEIKDSRRLYVNDDAFCAQRPLGKIEKAYLENPEATLAFFKEHVKKNPSYIKAITTPDGERRTLAGHMDSIDYYENKVAFGDWKVYETEVADKNLSIMSETLEKYSNMAAEKASLPKATEKDRQINDHLKKMQDKVSEIQKMRAEDKAKGIDFTDINHAKKMADEYAELHELSTEYGALDPTMSHFGGETLGFASLCNGENSLQRQLKNIDIINAKTQALEDFVATYKSPTMEKAAQKEAPKAPKQNPADVEYTKNKIGRLLGKLSTPNLYFEEKKNILSGILAYKTIRESIKGLGEAMTPELAESMMAKENVLAVMGDIEKSGAFTRLCNEIGEEGIDAIAADKTGKELKDVFAKYDKAGRDVVKDRIAEDKKLHEKDRPRYIRHTEEREERFKATIRDVTNTDVKQKNFASLLACQTSRDILSRVGMHMTLDQRQELFSTEMLKASAHDIYKSPEFKELCNELGVDGIIKIAKDTTGKEIKGAFDRMNAITNEKMKEKFAEKQQVREAPKVEAPQTEKKQEGLAL